MKVNLNSPWGRIKAWFYAMFVEHNLINLLRLNFHRISEGSYRSAQPTMSQMRRIVKKYGIKTIVNLKGSNEGSAYWAFEKEQCTKLGVKLVNVDILSRETPWLKNIKEAKEVFESIEYPMWMHCKAGSDRTGIYATLFQYFHLHIPIDQTDQLKLWPYGHIRHSEAGKIDNYLRVYLEYQKDHPDVGLLEWAEKVADRDKIDREFVSGGLARFINDYVLRRE